MVITMPLQNLPKLEEAIFQVFPEQEKTAGGYAFISDALFQAYNALMQGRRMSLPQWVPDLREAVVRVSEEEGLNIIAEGSGSRFLGELIPSVEAAILAVTEPQDLATVVRGRLAVIAKRNHLPLPPQVSSGRFGELADLSPDASVVFSFWYYLIDKKIRPEGKDPSEFLKEITPEPLFRELAARLTFLVSPGRR